MTEQAPQSPGPAGKFDYSADYASIDFRAEPERYRVGKGEQGVLLVEPYKSEILPHWRFRTPEIAQQAAETIFGMFRRYKEEGDFVGMDMARKFLQMGWTRARRYANHRSGRKYDRASGEVLPRVEDSTKAEAASIFRVYYDRARTGPEYAALRRERVHKESTRQPRD